MEINENQIQFLLNFFVGQEIKRYELSEEVIERIARKLIIEGKCIVAGNKRLWAGGVGNFIKTEEHDDYIGCLVHEFHIKEFLDSKFFKEIYANKMSELDDKMLELTEASKDLAALTNIF